LQLHCEADVVNIMPQLKGNALGFTVESLSLRHVCLRMQLNHFSLLLPNCPVIQAVFCHCSFICGRTRLFYKTENSLRSIYVLSNYLPT